MTPGSQVRPGTGPVLEVRAGGQLTSRASALGLLQGA